MTEEQLQQIEERSKAAQPLETSHSLAATCESMRDVPALITEVRRLHMLLDENELFRCFRHITKSLGIRVDDMVRMEGEVKRLRDALTYYGEHGKGPDLRPCPKQTLFTAFCTCGFDEAQK